MDFTFSKSISVPVLLVLLCQSVLLGQSGSDGPHNALLRSLADPTKRSATVELVKNIGAEATPVLIRWSRTTPEGVDVHHFKVGLADAFGALRAPEAVPFLVDNLLLSRTINGNHWMKSERVIERRLPAVGALVAIGPRASEYLIARFQSISDPEARARAVFVVARIADGASEPFLKALAAAGTNGLEKRYAQRGLASVAAKSHRGN